MTSGKPLDHDVYMDTVNRLEPEIHSIDPGAYYASAAISLKRIADALEASNAFKFAEMPNLLNVPGEQLLDAVKGGESSTPETQNFGEQPTLTIVEDFEAIWMMLNRVLVHIDSGVIMRSDRDDIVRVMNMFQNPAIIKDSRI